MAKFKPLGDRALILRVEPEAKSPGGIVLPDMAKEKPVQGKIVAVGPGRITEDGKFLPVDVSVGDTVLFGRYSGSEVKLDGTEYLIIAQSDILGVIEL